MSKFKNVGKDINPDTKKLRRLRDKTPGKTKSNLTHGAFGKPLKQIDARRSKKANT